MSLNIAWQYVTTWINVLFEMYKTLMKHGCQVFLWGSKFQFSFQVFHPYLAFKDHHTIPKLNILSLLIWAREKPIELIWSERIFHFGRVWWSWKANTYIQAERTRPWQNISGHRYIHTSKEREKQVEFIPFNCVGRLCLVFPFQNLLLLRSNHSIKGQYKHCVWV